ncbi:hypothetical protein FHU33_3912 [Blastococcus colisei]|uniref:DUF2742 domain-containing protein n=1 Tax=Blastococcus colisei TaxID=1564162 RepID=A0A543PJZ8_9ACTN|nr:hypothetical protein [Blastococcus colisei]TQN44410.1 hypothetical protein FHU33_3912 [Blastococcus colisei]
MTRPLPLPGLLPWEDRLIAAAGDQPIPDYGSREWHALPENSAIRVAACVHAAAAWRTYTNPAEIALRLRIELDEARELDRLEHDLDGWTPTLTRRQRASYAKPGPSQLELARRRGDEAAAERAQAQQAALDEAFPLQRHQGAA